MSPEAKTVSPVYASWVTVQNALDSLGQGVPPQIDRSLFPGLNWAVQSQLLTGLRFLKLIDEAGNSTPELIKLAEDTDHRKENWTLVLREAYKDLFAMDVTKVSPLQLETAIGKLGVSGDTLEKAVRFFVAAAEFCGLPLSPHLQRRRKQGTPRKKRTTLKVKNDTASPSEVEPEVRVRPQDGASKTVRLASGGVLEFSVSVNLFSLSTEDRGFVFGMIDMLQSYERRNPVPETPEDEIEEPAE